jgi:ankyrin repeat protein
MTPLHLASRGGREEVTRFLVEHGADVTAQDNNGMTPLHLASRGGHARVARILVEHNADGTAHDSNGVTPLLLASRHGSIKSTRFLVERGAVARVTAQDNSGSTPLPLTAEIMDRTSWFIAMLVGVYHFSPHYFLHFPCPAYLRNYASLTLKMSFNCSREHGYHLSLSLLISQPSFAHTH